MAAMNSVHGNDNHTKILVVDDEANMRHMLSALLGDAGYCVDTSADGRAALELLETGTYDYIFCDIRMPSMDGMAFLEAAGSRLAETSVIMMSAYGTIDTAVEAMKKGAYDYISKPFKPDEILLALKKAEERESLKRENRALKFRLERIAQPRQFGEMIAESRSMQAVFELGKRVAQYDITVLITGQSGTGKELMARGIHTAGKRGGQPFIPVNCAGIPENLLESELFGHKKGAFTGADRDYKGLFEAASGGTLFLDEIGDLPMSLQVKLLRVLQDSQIRPVGTTRSKTVDTRIVAATSKDLAAQAEQGNFREDLFYRLNVMPIHLPPLVERSEDIASLVQFFIERYQARFEKKITGISARAMSLLMQHSWPGNVRELENVIERAVVLAEEPELDEDLFAGLGRPENKNSGLDAIAAGFSLKSGRQALEQVLIQKALAETGGNRTRAARLLEISHPSLLSKMKTYGIG
ncbi:two-component system response regulator AtoC [Desulfosalsimonas propionicica]|uniref:Two-component system response regulator AtoC n=1 Tax=Desulfosalsimonas propionicica TaxID=332175 RepID=A0A7W0HL25_9BACT|nr:sigma-54 dependent transcriptional regulator [Desulfosalsimonas propionicica]MBA2881691.1 two-component system response regulator AtoC [Desulfosalsimonas propionicica]